VSGGGGCVDKESKYSYSVNSTKIREAKVENKRRSVGRDTKDWTPFLIGGHNIYLSL
jgi:hypothetical protein